MHLFNAVFSSFFFLPRLLNDMFRVRNVYTDGRSATTCACDQLSHLEMLLFTPLINTSFLFVVVKAGGSIPNAHARATQRLSVLSLPKVGGKDINSPV